MSTIRIGTLVHCENTRRVLMEALDKGWTYVGYTKGGHLEISWPATDARLFCATTPSDRNGWKTFAKDIEKASGVVTHRKGNRRQSRKPVKPSGFSLEAAMREQRAGVGDMAAAEAERARRVAAAKHEREARLRREEARRRANDVAEAERHRQQIEDLMQPSYGR